MDIFTAIEKRYSHKEKFLPTAVPLADLEKIAAAGLAAPSGTNSGCVKLIILQNREEIQPLCDITPTDALLTAPAVIVVFTEKSKQNWKCNFELEDYAAATAQMLLAATALGYSSLWQDSPFFVADKQRAACELLNVPLDYHLRVVLPIGLPDGEGSRREKLPFSARVSYGKFGK
ncbi:MAG: nitroreductase family protein [Lachnospiraceae bacterium]|jgi:nitroreductase|nr:nitroreductase family protein [Lachnospiraceae bacterium]